MYLMSNMEFVSYVKCQKTLIILHLFFDSASDIKDLKIVKNQTEAISITKKLQQSTPSKLSPENDCLLTAPSPVKIIEKPTGVLVEKQLNDFSNIRNGSGKGSQEALVNGFLKKSTSAPRMTNGVMPRSPINGVHRYASTNGNAQQRYTPPFENGSKNVRYTPTKEEQQRPRRNSSECYFVRLLLLPYCMLCLNQISNHFCGKS